MSDLLEQLKILRSKFEHDALPLFVVKESAGDLFYWNPAEAKRDIAEAEELVQTEEQELKELDKSAAVEEKEDREYALQWAIALRDITKLKYDYNYAIDLINKKYIVCLALFEENFKLAKKFIHKRGVKSK